MAHVCISWWSFLFLTNHVAKSMRLLKKSILPYLASLMRCLYRWGVCFEITSLRSLTTVTAWFGHNIWHKYHSWYFKIVSNFTRLTAREITNNNFEIPQVIFMSNITTNHAITYANFTETSIQPDYMHLVQVTNQQLHHIW